MSMRFSSILAALPVLCQLIPGFRDFLADLMSEKQGPLRPQVQAILEKAALADLDNDLSRIEKELASR